MDNIYEFPGSAKSPKMQKNEELKTNKKATVIAFFIEAVKIILSPFVSVLFYFLNKVSTLLVVSAVLMATVFYQQGGVTKYFLIAIAYLFVAVLIKMICNKKGR